MDADKTLLKYISSMKSKAEAKNALMKFEGLFPYLNLIAEKNDCEPFDFDVVYAYWIGNKLLDEVSREDIQNIIRTEFSKYLTKSIAEKLASSVPEDVVPHHSFHVLHVLNTKSLTGRVPANEHTLKNCLISWGKVIDAGEEDVVVEYTPLNVSGHFSFGDSIETRLVYPPYPIASLSVGDTIAFHWGTLVNKLGKKDVENLETYTQRNINALNSSLTRR